MKIAVYTIAKNEEQFVERWYESSKEADYQVILDTGSDDDTVKRAKELGIITEVREINPWRFDQARNASLYLVPDDADICIALDMDEVFQPGWRDALESITLTENIRPRYKYVWSWKEDGSEGVVYNGDKIHPRHGYEWRHPVHEVIGPLNKKPENHVVVDMEIHHHPDSSKPRSQYLPLLKLSVQEDPDDPRNAYYYARELYYYKKYDEAVVEFKRFLNLPRATWKPERSKAMRFLFEITGDLSWLGAAIGTCPDRREPWIDYAMWAYNNQKWQDCLFASKKAISIKERPMEYISEPQAWGDRPFDLAAIASYNLGDIPSAIFYGTEALRLSPDNERLQKNVEFYRQAL